MLNKQKKRAEEQRKGRDNFIATYIGDISESTSAVPAHGVDQVKVRTRLNAHHEWKFRIARTEPFSKVQPMNLPPNSCTVISFYRLLS